LITLSGEGETEYKILPGENPAVEVPDDIVKGFFVQALIADKQLAEVTAEQPAEQEKKTAKKAAE
jgi:hypothetical protein